MADPPKRCLYEVLGVERDASATDIRLAYRRLALQLHPDKLSSNPNANSNSTALFQELQHAYEVLSDPKERIYYDSHRSQILFSDLSNANSKSSLFDLNLFSYFSTSAFTGFSDTGRGFYKVYGDLFTKIYSQEVVFATRMGMGSDSVDPPPLMGNLDSPYAQVTAFYNYWLTFCTIMDFAWVDEYDSSLGPNRRSKRIMEEENKKIRKKSKREYNDSVRGLAAFAKKRDKRVVDMLVKKKNEEEQKKKEALEKKKEEARIKMEKAKAYEEPDWAKIEEGEEFDDDDDEDLGFEKKKREEFYCVVCNKKFKSDKQWKNHEQSKKHKEKVNELRLAIEEEEEMLMEMNGEDENGEEGEVNGGFDYEPAKDSDSDPERENEERENELVDEVCEELGENLEINKEDVSEERVLDNEEEIILETILPKGIKVEEKDANFNSFSFLDNDEDNDEEEEKNKKKGRKSRRANKEKRELRKQGNGDDEEKENGDDGKESSSSNAKNFKGKNIQFESSSSKGGGKKGKKDMKKASLEEPSSLCETCGDIFDSRNKLFSHLTETGHSMLKSTKKRSK